MKYSVVIPTYNHCDDLLKPCVEAVLKFSKVSDIELIISANGCTDNTFEYLAELKSKYKQFFMEENLKIVWNDKPLGFARATNAGIKVATTDRIVLLNNDAILLDQEKNYWLDMLNSAFQNEKCAVSGVLKRPSEITKSHFIVFFCVMIDRKVFDKIGYLNEDYEIGGQEDIDFCRAAELAGYTIEQPIPMVWSQEAMLHVGVFPIYHRGEATVHDTNLVQNWQSNWHINELKLAKKYNPEWYETHRNSVTI